MMCGKQFLENIFLPVEVEHTLCQHGTDPFLDAVLTLSLRNLWYAKIKILYTLYKLNIESP